MGIQVAVAGWHGPVCHALRRVLSEPPAEAHLYRGTLAHAAEHGPALARDAQYRDIGRDLLPERYPLAAFLLQLPPRLQPIERTLSWLTLEAHLVGASERLVHGVAQVLRGLARGPSSKLNHTIAECDGPSHLLAKMRRLGDENPDLGITGHQNFDALWHDELKAFCRFLVLQAQDGLEDADELEDPLNRPGAMTENPTDGADEDADEGGLIPSCAVLITAPIREGGMRRALDWSTHMSRCSSPDVLRPIENVLPADVREYRWLCSVRDAELALSKGNVREAEYKVLTVLSIETGLTARESLRTGFGECALNQGPVIDLEARALRRPEVLPVNSFVPKMGDDRWLSTGGDIIFPISARCATLIRDLREIRSRLEPMRAGSLLLSNQYSSEGKLAAEQRGKLRSATRHENRLVLAIAIADEMGIDAAQRAFGDTFGLSAAPTFYGAYPALALAQVIVRANDFAGHESHAAPWVSAVDHMLGSRARPVNPPYKRAWERLRGDSGRGKGRPSDRKLVEHWRLRRDRLLIHFLLVTGNRPNKSIAEMVLHDFIPRHAMAVVGDKQSDPLHQTRLICTGWRFVGELEGYVAELTRIARNSTDVQARKLASAILVGDAPLFAVPGQAGISLPHVRDILMDLDPIWGERPNLHRHGLCQYLQRQGVDPEYRYAQMGWLCHEHHATSGTSPYSAATLGDKLAAILDGWLDECGWQGGVEPKDAPGLMPIRELIDWKSRHDVHVAAGASALVALRAALRDSEQGLVTEVWDRIGKEAAKVLVDFEPAGSGERPAFRAVGNAGEGADATIDQMQVEALLAPFAKASCSPALRFVAARTLRKALLATAKDTETRVHLPSVPVLSRNRDPSPFLKGMGLAVAQVDTLQEKLVTHLMSLNEPTKPRCTMDLAAIAAISILLHSTCDSIEGAITILQKVDAACHADTEPWQLRVPHGAGHIVLRGDPAILATHLQRRPDHAEALQKLSRNGASGVGTFLAAVAPALVPTGCSAPAIVQLLEGTADVVKLIRSNGPGRLVARNAVVPALVTAMRAASVADGVTVGDGMRSEGRTTTVPIEPPRFKRNPSHRPKRDIRPVMRAFNPDFQGDILGKPAEPPAKRRPQLRRLLEDALHRVGATPTAGRLILEYAWHLLTEGGPRSSGGQQISTIYKTYHRLEPILRGFGEDESLEDLSEEQLTAACRFACQSSRRSSSRAVLGELRRFLDQARLRYRLAEPAWDLLYRLYGQPVEGGDPALVGDIEAALILERLHANVLEMEGTDSDPAERRFREVCLAAALIAEAGAIRPRSIHGLTLADAILGPELDYVHLRSRGRFASVKTPTSLGYIPLEGDLWNTYRSWFAQWLGRMCITLPAENLETIPLFQIPGQPIGVRYEISKVFGALGELVRWATQHSKGRTYWLRKRRVWKRHSRVMRDAGSRARDMAGIMRLDGHALMITPMTSYLGESGAYLPDGLMTHSVETGAGSTALYRLTGVGSSWIRRQAERGSRDHVAKLLGLGHSTYQAVPLPAPPSMPSHRADLAWSSTERILRDLAEGADDDWVAARHGVELNQVSSIITAQRALTARLKISLGTSASDLAPPRRINALSGWYDMLEAADERLALVALEWVGVAGTPLIRVGCELGEERIITTLKAMADSIGTKYETSAGSHGTTLLRFVDGDRPMNERSRYGAWPGLRWILALVWIAQYRVRGHGEMPPNR